VARVGGAHRVLGVEHLLGELGDGERAVLLGAVGGERREAAHEEVQTRICEAVATACCWSRRKQ
jgi:molybdopterin synthase catalytic subunit